MRFRALVYKEIRECLPYVIGAAVLIIAFGFIFLREEIKPESIERHYNYYFDNNSVYSLFRHPRLQPVCGWFFTCSIGLGIALGIRQYWVEFFTRTWGFLLHHSVNRCTILASKLFSGLLSFIPLAVIWLLFYIYSHNKQHFPIPPVRRILWEGFIFAAFGYISYLAVAMAALSRAKWYTTKMISIALGLWVFITLTTQWRLTLGWLTIIIAAVIMLVQITNNFLNRQFE